METPKLVSISLVGLGLNALFNGVFILQIGRVSDSALLAQSMILWSGFFVAGACVAPFENYFLYRRIDGSEQYSKFRVVQASSLFFLFVGLSVSFSQNVSFWIFPLTLILGFCVGQTVYLRSEAIYQGELSRVSISNIIEGLSRLVSLTLCVAYFEKVTLWQILFSYAAGNFFSLLPYLKLQKTSERKTRSTLSIKRIFGLSAIGMFTALITGGLPYTAGFFDGGTIPAILYFFTISRSLLIFQSVLVYVKPNWAQNFGAEASFIILIKFLFVSVIPIFSLLVIVKISVEMIMNVDMSLIDFGDIVYFSIALVVSAYFQLKIASQNATSRWLISLTAGVFGYLTACLAFVIVDSAAYSFYWAMILSPLMGLALLLQMNKTRRIIE